MGRRRAGNDGLGPARVSASPAVQRFLARFRLDERKHSDQRRHQPAAESLCDHADRGVIPAVGRRGHARPDAHGLTGQQPRVRDAQRARRGHPGDVIRTESGADPCLLSRDSAPRRAAARRSARRLRQQRALARRRKFRPGIPVFGRGSGQGERRRRSARQVPLSIARLLRRARHTSSLRPRLHRCRPGGRRARRHREPEPRAAHVPQPGCREPAPDVDRPCDALHRRIYRAAPHRGRQRGHRR